MKKLKKEYAIVIVAIAAILVSVGILIFTNSASTLFDFSRLGASVVEYSCPKNAIKTSNNKCREVTSVTTKVESAKCPGNGAVYTDKNKKCYNDYSMSQLCSQYEGYYWDSTSKKCRSKKFFSSKTQPVCNFDGDEIIDNGQKCRVYLDPIKLVYQCPTGYSHVEGSDTQCYKEYNATKKIITNSKSQQVELYQSGKKITNTQSIEVGKSFKVTSNVDVIYSSSNTNVAIIDSTGIIVGKNSGTATITAASKSNNNIKRTFIVKVVSNSTSSNSSSSSTSSNGSSSSTNSTVGTAIKKELTLSATREALEKGESITLTANEQVTWTSSNTKVATVDSKGKVNAVNYGTATITAKSKDGATKKVLLYIGKNIDISKNYGPNVTISPTTDKSVYVTAKDNNKIDYIVIRENNSKGTIINKTYTKDVTQIKIMLIKLPDVGSKLRYYITTKDKSSNVSSYTFTVQNTNGKYTVNNGPQLENTNVKLMEVNNNKYLFFRFADSNGITKVQYSTNNKTYKTVNLTGEKYATYYIKLSDIPKDKEGVYTVYLSSTDKGDNVTRKQKLEFKIR